MGQKQREYRELVSSPTQDNFGPQGEAAARQRAAFAVGSPLELSLSPARLDGGGGGSGTHGRGGWLRKWSDVDAQWRRVWCVLQGRALLCYAEAHAEMDVAAGGPPSSRSAVPEGADLERPTEVLWPYDGAATRGSDTVQAPSQHLIHLMGGPSGRSHRLCLEAGSTSAHLDAWLRLLSVPPDGGGDGRGGGGGRRGSALGDRRSGDSLGASGDAGDAGGGGIGGSGGSSSELSRTPQPRSLFPGAVSESPGPLLTVPAGVLADLGESGSSTASTAPRAPSLRARRNSSPSIRREGSMSREASTSILSEAARSARDNCEDVFYDAEEYDVEGDAAPDAQMLHNTVTAC